MFLPELSDRLTTVPALWVELKVMQMAPWVELVDGARAMPELPTATNPYYATLRLIEV